MSDSCRKYVENELNLLKDRLENINNEIHSSNIELKTIDKNIKKLNKEKDWTEDIFHSVTSSTDTSVVAIEALKNNKSKTLQKITDLSEEKQNVAEKIETLNKVLEEDMSSENVSRETLIDSQNNSVKLIDFIEMDRQRISRDIHDGVVQNLTALIHKQEFIYQIADKDINRGKLEINNSITLIKDSIDELRNIIYQLRPMSIDDLGFKNALTHMLDKFDRESDNVIYDYSINYNDDITINSTITISILRIINELNSNAIKYSGCTNIYVNVELDMKNNCIIVNFKDNGCGFDFENILYDRDKHSGFGMAMLKERVSLLKGTIQYSNNNGSQFLINIPVWWGGLNNGN